MQIESGTTSWWRNRHLLFVGMALAFGLWFGYDGYYAWPAENLKMAAQAMEVPAESLRINGKVTLAAIRELKGDLDDLAKQGVPTLGLVVERVKARLGEPALVRGEEHWWVGPAVYVKVAMQNGQPHVEPVRSEKRAENSIRGQRWLALALFVVAALMALKLVRVMTMRVVLDDAGLRHGSRTVSWDAMTGLRIDDYERKYWVFLEYTAGDVTRSLRLDSLHIDKFKEIVTAICERKGFASPFAAAGAKDEAGAGEPPQA